MKIEMRRELARQPFEQKIRKVGALIRLSTKLKAGRTGAKHLARSSPSVLTQAKANAR